MAIYEVKIDYTLALIHLFLVLVIVQPHVFHYKVAFL
jgi:hypothetical protein